MSGREERPYERTIPTLAGFVLAVPFLVVRYPPMGDLAFHEAGVSLLRHLGDPRFVPPGLYTLNLGEPNQLFHLLALPLSFVLSTAWACKLVVAGVVMAIAAGAGRLAAHLEVSPWSSLLVAPLALGWMMRWGLVANLLGFALLLGSLPVADRAAESPTPRRALGAVALTFVLFFAHESAMVLYALATLIFAVRTPRRLRTLALAMAPAFAAGALALLYHLRSASLKGPSILAVQALPVSFGQRILDVPASLFSVGAASYALFLGSLSASVALRLFSPRRTEDGRPWHREIPWRFVAFGGLCCAGYFVMPEAVFGSTLIYQRFLPPAFAVLAMAFLPRRSRASRMAPLLALLPLAMLCVTAHLFVEADRSYRNLDRVLAQMTDGAATAQLDLTPRNPSVVAPVVGDAARALAVHGGRLLFSFTDAPTYPVTMPPERRWNEPVERMVRTPFAFAPAYDLTRFRYVLVREPAPRLRAVMGEAFAPEAKLIAEAGSWMLFESNLPLVSVVADEGLLPSPPPTPLATRVKELLARPRPSAL